jgi:signal transduction histidine kinase
MREMSRRLENQPAWSDLPILVFTSIDATIQAMRPTAALLAPLGNVTLLDRPVRVATLVSAARAALRTRRRQYVMRQQLRMREAEVESRDRFLAMLGHELRNPLGAMMLALQVAERTGGTPQSTQVLLRQTRHLGRLVDDLLDISRVTRGKIELRKEAVQLDELVMRAVETLSSQANAQNIDVRVDLARDLPSISGDPTRLEQAVMNLLSNAIKYTPGGGHVTVAAHHDADAAEIRIKDDGVGIPVDQLDKIFELFAQLDETLDRSRGGLGIGLTLVRSLVEMHGGTVTAQSDGRGKGSEFVLRLPLGVPIVSVARSLHAPARPTRALHVLVVEDNPDHRAGLMRLLEMLGHRVEAVADGESGVSRALVVKPDVMLVDIGLPGFDGYEVARRVRRSLGDTPRLIAVTGYGQPGDRDRAERAGFDVHLTKPVELATIEQLLVA